MNNIVDTRAGMRADAATGDAAGACSGAPDATGDAGSAPALRHRERFPLDVNRAPRAALLRVPGLGARVVDRILAARRHTTLRLVDLGRLCPSLEAARPFIVTPDWRPGAIPDCARPAAPPPRAVQLDLF
jgi:predicted DNA-binding helix-hairpin-helix protein